MRIKIENIFNKHSGEECIIVGSGHTMNKFDFKNFKGKIIFCGTAILRLQKIIPDYLVSCNNHFPVLNIKSHLNFLNQYKKMTWIFSDTGCYNDIWEYNEKDFNDLIPNYLTFDDRHFEQKKCKPEKKCCQFLSLYKNRKTIHEIVEEIFNIKFPSQYQQTISVAELALMFGLLMNFKKIYIQGVDMPSEKYQGKILNKKYYGYENSNADKILDEALKIIRKKYFFYYLSTLNLKPYFFSIFRRLQIIFNKNYSDFKLDLQKSLNTFSWLSSIAKKNKIKIYNLSPLSNLKLVDGIKTISSR
jgi:hypothetical protein